MVLLTGVPWLDSVLMYVGLIYVLVQLLKIVLQLVWGFRVHFLTRIFPADDLKTRYGEWAVVTGGTDGIGKAYARQLARRGVNVALVSIDKLAETAAELEKDFGIQTKSIQVDFSIGGETVYEDIYHELKSLEIGILVNNVGVIVPYPMRVCEMTSAQLRRHINVNVGAATFMTSLLMPNMIDRKRGAIVNVASISAIGPLPLLAVYAATKSYVERLSSALQFEYRGSGVHVQTVTPCFVSTGMVAFNDGLSRSSFLVPSPQKFASHAVRTLGMTASTTGYWPHGVLYWLFTRVGERVHATVGGFLNIHFRNQYDKKQQLDTKLYA